MNAAQFDELVARIEAADPIDHASIVAASPVSTVEQVAELLDACETDAERLAVVTTNKALAARLAEQREAAAVYAEVMGWSARVDSIASAPASERARLIAGLTASERELFISAVLAEREIGGDERAAAQAYFAMIDGGGTDAIF